MENLAQNFTIRKKGRKSDYVEDYYAFVLAL